jgi:hypothetical protein
MVEMSVTGSMRNLVTARTWKLRKKGELKLAIKDLL